MLCCVTGVSGSGKSTLVNDVLLKAVSNRLHRARQRAGVHRRITGLEQLDKIISVDQSPIGRTPRSNPATYIGLFDQIRELFSKTQEARARGYKPGRFSFNVKGGRCEVCRGDGQIKIEMHFLPDVYVPCEQCHGKRYNRETLEVRFKGKTIADVLEMPIEEAIEFFAHIPKIRRRVQALFDVGLGYMRLGQPATTLSGGEAQRVKLAAELSKVATGRTMYILDEPTTGLHFADIQRLLEVLQRLVDAGNSVVVIEHNLDVIKVSDRLIDLGPEGGDEGGQVIAHGTPEDVAAVPASHTGWFWPNCCRSRPSGPVRRRQERLGAVGQRDRAAPQSDRGRALRPIGDALGPARARWASRCWGALGRAAVEQSPDGRALPGAGLVYPEGLQSCHRRADAAPGSAFTARVCSRSAGEAPGCGGGRPSTCCPTRAASTWCAARGHTQWVRNLRASGDGRLLLGRRVQEFAAQEVDGEERVALLRAYLKRWAWEVGAFFDGVSAKSSDDELARIAADHPVFRVMLS